MATQFNLEEPVSGFSFENARRNLYLKEKGYNSFKTTKTGTTICAVIYKGGIVFGADNRSTAGNIVANKFTFKIHELAPNIVACGAGTSADCSKVTELLASQLKLHRLETGRQCRVVTAERILTQRLFQYQGNIQSYLIVGGVDVTGTYIYNISAGGCTSPKLYAATGSGMLGALAELESRYKVNMTEEEAKELVKDAILAGIFNDNASGSNVDIAITRVSDGSMEIIRGYSKPNKKGERKNKYTYPKGTTAILSEVVKPTVIASTEVQPMET